MGVDLTSRKKNDFKVSLSIKLFQSFLSFLFPFCLSLKKQLKLSVIFFIIHKHLLTFQYESDYLLLKGSNANTNCKPFIALQKETDVQ